MSDKVLIYVGKLEGHGAYVQGVPACDLTEEMVSESGLTVKKLLRFKPQAFALPDSPEAAAEFTRRELEAEIIAAQKAEAEAAKKAAELAAEEGE